MSREARDKGSAEREIRLVEAIQRAGGVESTRLEHAWAFGLIVAQIAVVAASGAVVYASLEGSLASRDAVPVVVVTALALVWIHLGHRVMRSWRTRTILARRADELQSRVAGLRASGDDRLHSREDR